MGKFDRQLTQTRPVQPVSPIVTKPSQTLRTYNGAPGFERDAKGELFLLAVTNFVSEDTFYEAAAKRDDRFTQLVHTVASADIDWLQRMLVWLRTEANMRSAAIAGAVEAVKAQQEQVADFEGTDTVSDLTQANLRGLISAVCVRADEPAELLAYAVRVFGKHNVPKPIKRGVADAAVRLYTERNALKYDGVRLNFRMGDVINLTHPTPKAPWQEALFKWLLESLYNQGLAPHLAERLPMVHARAELQGLSVADRQAYVRHAADPESDCAKHLARAGMTWEALSDWLQGPMDAQAWEAIIPSMGYMALLRNLRNFDQAGVSDAVAKTVADKLADPEEVAKSRQLPMRFLSAYRAAPSLRWSWALEQALKHSLGNIPKLGGRTLVLVDTSGSMAVGFSKDGTLMRWDAAAVFGIAFAHAQESVDLVSFSDAYYGVGTKVFPVTKGGSVLSDVKTWKDGGYFINGGTDTAGAVSKHYAGHDRVIVLTDEQANDHYGPDVYAAVPATVPVYTFNLAGYRPGSAPSGTKYRHTFGGLTDAGFKMISILESVSKASWPF